MSKETAVEWLNQQLIDKQNGIGDSRSWDEIVEQAKEMEKEQIVKAHGTKQDYSNGSQRDPNIVTGEVYYEKTYGGANE